MAGAYALDQAQAAGSVLYVTPTATIGTLCTSWTNPCSLQAALSKAASGDEIWVAAGTYKPTSTTDRAVSFNLKSGVKIYGGFAGTETARSQRDWRTNVTILSGDIGVAGDSSDNSYHVVYAEDVDATAVLDGFEIHSGSANGSMETSQGGGMLCIDSSPSLANLVIYNNHAAVGGGLYNALESSPSLVNVTFRTNEAGYGGGIYNWENSNPILVNVIFAFNSAEVKGGGMYNGSNSAPTLVNVTFNENEAGSYGGGDFQQ